MAIFNGNKEFSKKRELSQPLVPVPKNVRQAFNIQKAYANRGVPVGTKKRIHCMICYVFEDINTSTRTGQKKRIFIRTDVLAQFHGCVL